MKYESTILKRLIDTYGVVGNPRYISEIIKEFIVRGKERFPDLFTYQADWLAHIDEFGLNPSYTVSYTGQSIYAPNTLERPVKSAILKGSTKYRDIDTGEFLETFEEGRNLELVSVKMPVLTTTGKNLFDKTKIIFNKLIDWNTGIISDYSTTNTTDFIKVIPNTQYTMSFNFTTSAWTRCVGFTEPKQDKYATDVNGRSDKCYFDSGSKTITFTTSPTTKYLIFSFGKGVEESFQIEQGSTATSYEPYKSNILSCNEEVALRGIGDVQDTLDLMTGELTQRIGEIVLDGSEDETYNIVVTSFNGSDNTIIEFVPIENLVVSSNNDYTNMFLSNYKLNQVFDANWIANGSSLWATYLGLTNLKTTIRIIVPNGTTDTEIRQHLRENPLRVVCKLETPTIKTVDLTILDQNGQNVEQLMSFKGGTHFNTRSSEGSLLPLVSVSVETDLEETLRVCSLEGNTM